MAPMLSLWYTYSTMCIISYRIRWQIGNQSLTEERCIVDGRCVPQCDNPDIWPWDQGEWQLADVQWFATIGDRWLWHLLWGTSSTTRSMWHWSDSQILFFGVCTQLGTLAAFIQNNPLLEPFDLPNLVSIGGGLFIWVLHLYTMLNIYILNVFRTGILIFNFVTEQRSVCGSRLQWCDRAWFFSFN